MSTSKGDSAENVHANRQEFLNEFSIDEAQLAQPIQISRAGIEIIHRPGKYAECDALITEQTDVYLSILTADCTPVLIWSEDRPLVAAVHSGWQGSELDILGHTIREMMHAFNVSPASLSMVIGPGLSQDNFEVGPEFSEKFKPEYLRMIPDSDHSYFNNNQHLMDTGVKHGIPVEQIEVMPFCSYRDQDLFFSHRRDKEITGRMMSVIGIHS